MKNHYLALLFLGIVAADCAAGERRTWTSADGKFRVVGEMIGFADDVVVIRKNDKDDPIRVPISKLSKTDIAFAREFEHKAMGTVPRTDGWVEKQSTDRWLLDSKISIGLPVGAHKWKLVTNDPLTFAAVDEDESKTVLTLIWHPFVESHQKRIELLKTFQAGNVESLKAIGINDPKGEPIDTSAPGKLQQYSTIGGPLPDGTAVVCRSTVRFDPEGCVMFRSVGSNAETSDIFETVEKFSHAQKSDTAKEAPAKSELPEESKKSFNEFVAHANQLLRDADPKTIIESLITPDELKQLNSSKRMDAAVAGFDSKRGQLQEILSSLDWSNVEYDGTLKQLTFKTSSSSRPIRFVETSLGWRMKN
jgi:hypothetical protein